MLLHKLIGIFGCAITFISLGVVLFVLNAGLPAELRAYLPLFAVGVLVLFVVTVGGKAHELN